MWRFESRWRRREEVQAWRDVDRSLKRLRERRRRRCRSRNARRRRGRVSRVCFCWAFKYRRYNYIKRSSRSRKHARVSTSEREKMRERHALILFLFQSLFYKTLGEKREGSRYFVQEGVIHLNPCFTTQPVVYFTSQNQCFKCIHAKQIYNVWNLLILLLSEENKVDQLFWLS